MTLNQIIARVRSLALSHEQIKWFYFGDPWEFDTNGEIDYPACFLEQQPGSIDRTEHLQRFNFRIYFLNLVRVASGTEDDETEVLSDMSSVAADMLALLMNSEYQYDWVITASSGFTSVTEALGDMAAGCYIDVGISVDFFADRCQVPSEGVTFETDFDMARTRILTWNATGTEGSAFTVTNLAGKNVLAVWRAGAYKRLVITVPDDDEKILVTGTDLGNGKGILSTTGAVTLNSGDQPILNEKFDFLYYQ